MKKIIQILLLVVCTSQLYAMDSAQSQNLYPMISATEFGYQSHYQQPQSESPMPQVYGPPPAYTPRDQNLQNRIAELRKQLESKQQELERLKESNEISYVELSQQKNHLRRMLWLENAMGSFGIIGSFVNLGCLLGQIVSHSSPSWTLKIGFTVVLYNAITCGGGLLAKKNQATRKSIEVIQED